MEGVPTRLLLLLTAALALTPACKKPTPDPVQTKDSGLSPPATPELEGIDFSALVARAEQLRDREFPEPPPIWAVDETHAISPSDAVRADRDAILFGLFGRESFETELPGAQRYIWWHSTSGAVKYHRGNPLDTSERDRAVLLALLRGLDGWRHAKRPEPKTWDAYLAASAVGHGPSYLAATTATLRDEHDGVVTRDVAYYPGLILETPLADHVVPSEPDLEARAASFAPRQGFALAAALFRASGWSGVEMMWHDVPTSTAWIVRPDRWLEGEALGDWEWPRIPTKIREEAGWKVEQTGLVGPAVAALFLGEAVDPARARTVYVTWNSDSYRLWRKDEGWIFEWVTMWETPTAAEAFVEVAQKALASQGRDGRFSVMRQGPFVALVGSNEDDANIERHATSVVAMRPTFTPRDPGLVKFVPTPADAAADALGEATLQDGVWSDPATGLSVDLEPFEGWDIRKANELGIRWFARRDGVIVQFSTELPDPLAPPIASDEWKGWVERGFGESINELEMMRAERAEHAGREGWTFLMRGKIQDKPTTLRLWQFESEPDAPSGTPRIVSFSAQGPAESLDEAVTAMKATSIEVGAPEK